MSTTDRTTTGPFVAYDYLTIPVDDEKEALYRDTYGHFGWTGDDASSGRTGRRNGALHLRRDRSIRNRQLVDELQRTSERALRSIDSLERSRSSVAATASIAVGVIGAALLAVAVFGMLAGSPAQMVVFGAIGIALWALAYPLHLAVRALRSRAVAPRIEREHAALHTAGQQAARLLA